MIRQKSTTKKLTMNNILNILSSDLEIACSTNNDSDAKLARRQTTETIKLLNQ